MLFRSLCPLPLPTAIKAALGREQVPHHPPPLLLSSSGQERAPHARIFSRSGDSSCRRGSSSPTTPRPSLGCPEAPQPFADLAAAPRRRQVALRRAPPSSLSPCSLFRREADEGYAPSIWRSTARVVSRPVLQNLKSAKSCMVITLVLCLHGPSARFLHPKLVK